MYFLIASSKHRLMSQSERDEYRERYPHVAPEISKGWMQSVKSDTYSFGYLYCTTLKEKEETKRILRTLGQSLTHWNPEKRPDLLAAKNEILPLCS